MVSYGNIVYLTITKSYIRPLFNRIWLNIRLYDKNVFLFGCAVVALGGSKTTAAEGPA